MSDNNNEEVSTYDKRINDDLSIVILKYLPLADKYRLECVSKKFQRTIYIGHTHLNLNRILIAKLKLDKYPISIWNPNLNAPINISRFEQLLKKCLNIREISFRDQTTSILDLFVVYRSSRSMSIDAYNTMFLKIIQNCSRLEKIEIIAKNLKFGTRKKFIQRYANTLKSITIFYTANQTELEFTTRFRNLREINFVSHITQLKDIEYIRKNYNFPRLEKIMFCYHCVEDVYNSNAFRFYYHIFLHHPEINNVIVKFDQHFHYDRSFLTAFENLTNLTTLNIELWFCAHKNNNYNGLMKFSTYLRKLKFLTMTIEIEYSQRKQTGIILESVLKFFENLDDLLVLTLNILTRTYIDYYECIKSDIFRNNRNLKVLKLVTRRDTYLFNHFFENIGKNLPAIQYLNLDCCKINKFILEELSELRNLKELYIGLKDHEDIENRKTIFRQLFKPRLNFVHKLRCVSLEYFNQMYYITV